MIMIITIIMITIMMTTPMITRAAGCRGCRRACAPGYYYYYHYDYYHYYDYYDHDGLPAQQVAEGVEELARRGRQPERRRAVVQEPQEHVGRAHLRPTIYIYHDPRLCSRRGAAGKITCGRAVGVPPKTRRGGGGGVR